MVVEKFREEERRVYKSGLVVLRDNRQERLFPTLQREEGSVITGTVCAGVREQLNMTLQAKRKQANCGV